MMRVPRNCLELAINSIIYIEFLDGRFADPRMAADLECLRIDIDYYRATRPLITMRLYQETIFG